MSEKTLINDLTTGPVSRLLIRFSLPLMLSSLLQTVYHIIDLIVVGQFVGPAGLAAVSIGGDIQGLITFAVIGFTGASQVIIGQFVGAGDKRSVSHTIGTTFSLVAIASVIFTTLSILLAGWALDLVNTPAEAYNYTWQYSVTCFAGFIFIFGYNTVSAILRGMGDSKHPFIFITIAMIANLILDLVFVAGLGWAAFGAALATVLAQALSFIWSIIFLYRKRDAFGFDFKLKSFRIEPDIFKRIMQLGLPMSMQNAAVSFSMLFVNSFINAYGVIPAAVTGIGNKLGSIANVITGALSIACSSMVAQNIGARKYDRVPRILYVATAIGLGFCTLLSALMLIFPRAIFGIFNSDPAVLALAMTYIPIAILMFYGAALRGPWMGLTNGLGFPRLTLFIGLMDGIVARIGLALLLGLALSMGIQGFWYGNALAGYVPFLIGFGYFLSGRWKTHRLIIS